MIDEYDAETLAMHLENVQAKTEALDAAKTGRDDHIRAMLGKGAKPTELSKVAGMSRERIYQIKQHRR